MLIQITLHFKHFLDSVRLRWKPCSPEIDNRQRNSGDYAAVTYIEQKEAGKTDLVYEAVIYRRDEEDKLMILFTKPSAEAGKGYLRLDRNLFIYDPSVGVMSAVQNENELPEPAVSVLTLTSLGSQPSSTQPMVESRNWVSSKSTTLSSTLKKNLTSPTQSLNFGSIKRAVISSSNKKRHSRGG